MENNSSRKNPLEAVGYLVAVVALCGFSFFAGTLWQKVQSLEKTQTPPTTTGTTGQQNQQITKDIVKGIFDKEVIVLGNKDSANLFVEVADPSCPYCHIAAGVNPELSSQVGANFTYKSNGGSYTPPVPEMKKLVDEGKAAYAYIYTPGHGNGEMGTKALYCANEQGKFWEVHDLLMTNAGYSLLNDTIKNDKTKSQQLVDFVKSAADAGKLKTCIDSGKYDERLANDTALAGSLRAYGISGTPGFIVNEQVFPGAYNWSDMQSFVK